VLTAFAQAFKTPDLRKKLLFVLFVLVLFRIGSSIPAPGVSVKNINYCLKFETANGGDIYTLINLFSGGALLRLSILALGIMPYITASIIIQLLVVVIPRLEKLKEEGQAGQAKMTQYTRYLTIGLAVLQSAAFVALARSPGQIFNQCNDPATGQPMKIITDDSFGVIGTMVLTMIAGTAIIMWLGELITDRGIGNGMSILIFTQIAARFPSELNSIRLTKGNVLFGAVMIVGVIIIAAIVFVEQAQRRIPVQYAKRMIGRRMYGGTSTYLPLKVNQAGVIPVIFASSLLYIPSMVTSLNKSVGFQTWINDYLSPNNPHVTYLLSYAALIIFFTFFYVAITFNPDDVADNMKKYGGFIPGIRPGRPTAEYLSYVLSRITVPGATYLAVVAVLPELALSFVGSAGAFPFGGTSILIIVGVGLDTVKQIESQLMLRNYEGFLR